MEAVEGPALTATPAFGELEQHRRELTAYCYRMLGSPFEAEDAVQDTLLRAWKALDRFEGRSALRSWLYRIATNVCLDMLGGKDRRARPMDLGPAREPVADNLRELPEVTWIEPIPGWPVPEDATQSMPPYDLWLSGRDDILAWWVGPGIGCRGSRVIPTVAANGSPAFGQYKPSETGAGYEPWALQVLELSDGGIAEITFFL